MRRTKKGTKNRPKIGGKKGGSSGPKRGTKRVVQTGKKEVPKGWFKRVKKRYQKGGSNAIDINTSSCLYYTERARKGSINELKTEKNTAIFFWTDILLLSVKNLCSDPLNYPQVTFNKRYEGYRTVPSAVPYYRHSLYDRAVHLDAI